MAINSVAVFRCKQAFGIPVFNVLIPNLIRSIRLKSTSLKYSSSFLPQAHMPWSIYTCSHARTTQVVFRLMAEMRIGLYHPVFIFKKSTEGRMHHKSNNALS